MARDKEYKLFLADLRDLSKDSRFRKFIWHVLSACGIYSVNVESNPYYDGRRSIGLEVIELLTDADPTLYARLLLEEAEKNASKTVQEEG